MSPEQQAPARSAVEIKIKITAKILGPFMILDYQGLKEHDFELLVPADLIFPLIDFYADSTRSLLSEATHPLQPASKMFFFLFFHFPSCCPFITIDLHVRPCSSKIRLVPLHERWNGKD